MQFSAGRDCHNMGAVIIPYCHLPSPSLSLLTCKRRGLRWEVPKPPSHPCAEQILGDIS